MKAKISFSDEPSLKVRLHSDDLKIGVNFSNTIVNEKIVGDVYDGPYSVIPQLSKQELLTRNKILTENVSVEKIPTYEVSNDAGGETFILLKGDN